MKRKIKSLLLDTNDAMGGVVQAHIMFLKYIDRMRFDVYAAILRGPLLPQFKAIPGVTFWTMEAGTKPASLCAGWRASLADAYSVFSLLGSALRLSSLCKRGGIEVIHTSDKKRSLLLTLLLHRFTGIPFLYHIHNAYADYWANRMALYRAAMIVANSGEMRHDFIEHLGPSMERIGLLYNGIDAEQFKPGLPSLIREEIKAAPDEVLVGISSRLAPDKGQDTFLRAAARVAGCESRVRFVVIGDDSIFSDNVGYVPALRQMANESGLADRVAFLGFRRDMPSIYSGLDILVNAARREAFGLVVVEAMACGKVVVGTNAGGIPEIITHGRDGFLFPVNDDQTLADILLQLVRNPDLRRTMGEAARRTVVERFTIQSQVRGLEELLAGIAERKVTGL